MSQVQHHLISFCEDASLIEAIKQTAVSHRWVSINITDEAAIGPARIKAQNEALGEKLSGQIGRLFEKVTAWQPILLIFDLTNTAVPWQRWIPTLKTSPATRRFPILALVETEAQQQEAKRIGANYVATRQAFRQETAVLINKQARIPNSEQLKSTCAKPLAPLAQQGILLFNQGEFYKCHDALEEAWQQDKTPGRNLYRGILQIGIAYFQIERGNYRGAVKMLLRVRQWLDPLPDRCRGVDVATLRMDAQRVQTAVSELGPDKIDQFDKTLFKPIRLDIE